MRATLVFSFVTAATNLECRSVTTICIRTFYSIDFSGLEDKQLLHQISNGDEEALATLYDRYGVVVFSVALRILHDPQSAEEIVLDTFTKA